MKPFIETASGVDFWPLKPRIADICIEDIAHALSNQCRFSGHTCFHYSVAQHSLGVSGLLKRQGFSTEEQLWGLLHDASEAYLVDLPSPLKRHSGFAYYKVAEKRLMRAICHKFCLPTKEPECVRWADAVILATEVRDIMPGKPKHWVKLEESADGDIMIMPRTFHFVYNRFIERFEELCP